MFKNYKHACMFVYVYAVLYGIKRTDSMSYMIYGFLNSKGGCGKSTLSVHFAAWMQHSGKSVILVDADAQKSASTWLKEACPAIRCACLTDPDSILDEIDMLKEQAEVVVIDGPAGAGE